MCTPFLTASGKLASAADGMSSCNFCVASSDAYFDSAFWRVALSSEFNRFNSAVNSSDAIYEKFWKNFLKNSKNAETRI